MSYADQSMSGNRITAFIIVALIHIVVIYALVTGLAYEGYKKVLQRVTAVDIKEEVKKEPPPPPKKLDIKPPPLVVPLSRKRRPHHRLFWRHRRQPRHHRRVSRPRALCPRAGPVIGPIQTITRRVHCVRT
jgi:hypothetical protein